MRMNGLLNNLKSAFLHIIFKERLDRYFHFSAKIVLFKSFESVAGSGSGCVELYFFESLVILIAIFRVVIISKSVKVLTGIALLAFQYRLLISFTFSLNIHKLIYWFFHGAGKFNGLLLRHWVLFLHYFLPVLLTDSLAAVCDLEATIRLWRGAGTHSTNTVLGKWYRKLFIWQL